MRTCACGTRLVRQYKHLGACASCTARSLPLPPAPPLSAPLLSASDAEWDFLQLTQPGAVPPEDLGLRLVHIARSFVVSERLAPRTYPALPDALARRGLASWKARPTTSFSPREVVDFVDALTSYTDVDLFLDLYPRAACLPHGKAAHALATVIYETRQLTYPDAAPALLDAVLSSPVEPEDAWALCYALRSTPPAHMASALAVFHATDQVTHRFLVATADTLAEDEAEVFWSLVEGDDSRRFPEYRRLELADMARRLLAA